MILNRRQFMRAAAASVTGAFGLAGSNVFASSQLPREGAMPSLQQAVGWLNSEALDAAALRGKVVLINFWTYTCINSIRTLPYLRAWAEKYKRQNLVVIGVHTPEFTFEHNPSNVRSAVKKMNIDYPIAIDSDYRIWRAFKNQYWPAFYLADAQGCIRYHRFGEGDYQQSERVIQELLNDAGGAEIRQELVSGEGRGIEAAPEWASVQSPESYIGTALAQNFAGVRKSLHQRAGQRLKLNHWALEGNWTRGEEAATLNEGGGRVRYRFHARDLHLVMAPAASGRSIRFRVSIDGRPPGSAHGEDVDDQGNGSLSEPRLYQLIRQSLPVIDREFEIEFLESGAQVFDLTFG